MSFQTGYKNLTNGTPARLSASFIFLCIIIFVASVLATIYFDDSMGSQMSMPGGWKMSMMWMRMPGQKWFLSALSFLLMWQAMMVAMMMPSALPTWLKTQRDWRSLCYMASGYFIVWLIVGLGTYMLGMAFNNYTMQSLFVSRMVPLLSGISLIIAGVFQFTRWKSIYLSRCRSSSGCAISCPSDGKSFSLGCKQGLSCCACCASLMATQLILGIMNPFIMIVVAIAISAEKLFPRPRLTARFSGIAIIITGTVLAIHWAVFY